MLVEGLACRAAKAKKTRQQVPAESKVVKKRLRYSVAFYDATERHLSLAMEIVQL